MKLTTKLSHAKIRLKHKMLRMRLQQPLLYKTIFVLVLLVAMGGLAAVYFVFIAAKDTKTYAEQFDLVIEAYSLNGPVNSVDGNAFTMQSSIVETTNGVSTVKPVTRTINFTDSTAVYITVINGTNVSSKTGSINDIAVGKNITVYTSQDPGQNPILTATKLEIIQ